MINRSNQNALRMVLIDNSTEVFLENGRNS